MKHKQEHIYWVHYSTYGQAVVCMLALYITNLKQISEAEGNRSRRLNLSVQSRICKRLRSPGIDSKASIPPAYVAWRAGTTTRFIGWQNRFLGIDSWAA
jgi:hypothetical protein